MGLLHWYLLSDLQHSRITCYQFLCLTLLLTQPASDLTLTRLVSGICLHILPFPICSTTADLRPVSWLIFCLPLMPDLIFFYQPNAPDSAYWIFLSAKCFLIGVHPTWSLPAFSSPATCHLPAKHQTVCCICLLLSPPSSSSCRSTSYLPTIHTTGTQTSPCSCSHCLTTSGPCAGAVKCCRTLSSTSLSLMSLLCLLNLSQTVRIVWPT